MKIEFTYQLKKYSIESDDEHLNIAEINDLWQKLLLQAGYQQKTIEQDIIDQAEEIIAERNKL
jgi:hypothetical protein